MPGATLVSARPFYHILLKMSIGKMHKKIRPTPCGQKEWGFFGVCFGDSPDRPLSRRQSPAVGQSALPRLDRVDRLNPSKAIRNEDRQV